MTGFAVTRRDVRGIELVRGCWGLLLLVAPQSVLQRLHGKKIDTRAVRFTRILGARQLGQAVLSGVAPSPEVLAMGVWVDTVHSLSAVALATADSGRSRLAWADAGVAGAYAAAGTKDLASARATVPAHDRRRDTLARWALDRVPGGGPLLCRADRARARR
ncbi:MAG: hypothetical protein ACR2FG_00540 [Marmoricola sp.]